MKKRIKKATPVAKKQHSISETRYKEIKSFVTFKFNKKPSTARKIKKYYEQLHGAIRAPHIVIRSKDKRKLHAALFDGGGYTRFKELKVVPVTNNGAQMQVIYDKKTGKIKKRFRGSLVEVIPFANRTRLARDPHGYVNFLVRDYPDDAMFTPMSLATEFDGTHRKDQIADVVAGFSALYTNSHEWLSGIKRIELYGQLKFGELAQQNKARRQKIYESKKPKPKKKRKSRHDRNKGR